jgi:cysteinyl-tRNA synthetase
MVKVLLEKGYAYEKDGSVYFDVEKYNKDYDYGKLSGRKIEDLLEYTRSLAGKEDKKNSFDFALWKKADSRHIMRWPSPWSNGFPGWHLECSVMGARYLGERFDIHGGGMDLLFPHHECEIAQSNAITGHDQTNYWMHNNMITINGQKMGKSLNNFITLDEFFSGKHEALDQAYSPMTIRFFMLQAHYRSTLDFSNEALLAAEKGMNRLLETFSLLTELKPSKQSTIDVKKYKQLCAEALNDDFNTPIVLAHLFDLSRLLNQVNDGKEQLSGDDISFTKSLLQTYMFDLFGLRVDEHKDDSKLINYLMNTILKIRQTAKDKKDYQTSDQIRNDLNKMNIQIKDTKDGVKWGFK